MAKPRNDLISKKLQVAIEQGLEISLQTTHGVYCGVPKDMDATCLELVCDNWLSASSDEETTLASCTWTVYLDTVEAIATSIETWDTERLNSLLEENSEGSIN